ncbi:hypothetical protein PIB30_021144 [Stylosanthes scabra]|uniref:Secreted protein n=1 Tax=Stylosanthes scabra TaxID=79078 RepID=A0ABU6R935_9FABA|nr:hypothetical protein [Stylosanthes scabra]
MRVSTRATLHLCWKTTYCCVTGSVAHARRRVNPRRSEAHVFVDVANLRRPTPSTSSTDVSSPSPSRSSVPILRCRRPCEGTLNSLLKRVKKILVRKAIAYSATHVVLGTCHGHHKIQSSTSLSSVAN